jgi:hypothetical protein
MKQAASMLCLLPAACFMLVSCLAYSSTLKMEAMWSSEMLGDFQQTRHCISEDRALHAKSCQENILVSD